MTHFSMNSTYHTDNFAYKGKNSRQNNYFKTTRLQEGNKAAISLAKFIKISCFHLQTKNKQTVFNADTKTVDFIYK